MELLELSPGEAILDNNHSLNLPGYYAQWYALVRFLAEYDNGRYSAGYQGMLTGGLLGIWPIDHASAAVASDRNIPLTVKWNRLVGPAMMMRYISGDLDTLQEQYLDFCLRIVVLPHY